VVFLACVHLALFLALSLSPGSSLVSSWCEQGPRKPPKKLYESPAPGRLASAGRRPAELLGGGVVYDSGVASRRGRQRMFCGVYRGRRHLVERAHVPRSLNPI